MKAPSGTLVFLTSCIFAISPAIAFGQHGGGHASSGHAASISTHAGISSHGGSATSSASSQQSAKHPSIIVVSGRSDREAEGAGERWVSRSGSSSTTAANDQWLSGESAEGAHSRVVTIGFPETAIESRASAIPPSRGMAFVGERGNMWEEQVQRSARPAATLNRPAPMASGAPAMPASSLPSSHAEPRPLSRIQPVHIQTRRALWFLAPPGSGNQSHIFRRRFFGGFGFFGFGLPFSFGFGPDCNPFWAEPFAFGCNTFGYFDGFGGYGIAPQEQENQVEASQEQEPEENIFVPEEHSSPEEIEAEKVLFVLYMKNGALYAVTNYWIEDGKLHYRTSYGGENTIDMNDLDLQKTVDVNAKRGVDFTLKPRQDQNQTNEPQQ